MKPPILLKTILDIIYVIGIIALTAPLLVLLIYSTDHFIHFEINNLKVEEWNFFTISLATVNYFVSVFSVYVIYLIRKLVRSFLKNSIFIQKQITLFRLIGWLIIICSTLQIAVNIFSRILMESENGLRVTFKASFDNLFFVIAIGFFFIYLSKIFENAKALKEENELTV